MHAARKRRHGSVHAVKVIHGDPLAAFLSKVDKSGSCWEWTGSRSSHTGYGMFNYLKPDGVRKPTTAHRAAWDLLVGPIPAGMYIDHVCHNRGCVNPEHLCLATPKQNMENRAGAQRNSSTGVRGVSYDARYGTYAAGVQHKGVKYHAGTFKTLEEAAAAALVKRNELFTHNHEDRTTKKAA